MHIQIRNNKYFYLRKTTWNAETKKPETKSHYLGSDPHAARQKAEEHIDDPEVIAQIPLPGDFDLEIEIALKTISGLLIKDDYMPATRNGAIRAVLSQTLRQLAELREYGDEELPKMSRCKSCAHIGTNNMCLYFQKPFSGSDDKAICPRLQPTPPKKQTPEHSTDNKIALF